MNPAPFNTGIEQIPPGRWIVGVSGGADSVALLRLLHDRNDLSLHIAHIDHETRSGESAVDAGFVESLARDLNLPISMARRSEMEAGMPSRLKNRSAHFREVRIAFFKRVVAAQNADGVILAHHADDQAETILHRLIRGSGAASLAGMSARSTVNDLLILRPLLNSRRTALREFLRSIHQEWREDASNRSPEYTRNQLRMILAEQPDLHDSLIELGRACGSLRKWIGAAAPSLKAMFDVDQLASLASPLARRSASRWLAARGSPVEKLSPAVCDQLIQMASDFSTSPCQFFPGGLVVRRKKNVIFLETKDS